MVRTFLCSPYTNPQAFTYQYDPVSFCYTADDNVIISSITEEIYVHDLKRIGCPKLHTFASVGIPVKMQFCDSKQLLLSLESKLHDFKRGAMPKDMNCQVKVYINVFKLPSTNKPLCVVDNYTSAFTTSNSPVSYLNYVSKPYVINLNVRHAVSDVGMCRLNHNIAIACRKKIYLYGYCDVNIDAKRPGITLKDFFRIMEIAPSFRVLNITIFSNWMCFSSRNEVRVVQFFLSEPEDEQICQAEDVTEFLESEETSVHNERRDMYRKERVGSPNCNIGLDDSYVEWSFDPFTGDLTQSYPRQIDSQDIVNFKAIAEEMPFIDMSTTPKEVRGPCESVRRQPLRCQLSFVTSRNDENGGEYYGSVVCVTLLYRRFDPYDMSISGSMEMLHSLQFLPVFVDLKDLTEPDSSGKKTSSSWPWKIFDIPQKTSLVSLAFFFSNGKEGYVYDIYGSVREVVCYQFTSDCYAAVHSKSLLYVYTKNGLDIYTSRIYSLAAEQAKLKYKNKDVKMKQDDGAEKRGVLRQYSSKNRSDVDVFTDLNYYGSYVKIDREDIDGSTKQVETEASSVSYHMNFYSPQLLMEACPFHEVEVCLIGMYHLQNISGIDASSSFIIMLVKSVKKEKQGSTYMRPWSMFVLEKNHLHDLYKELTLMVEGNEYSNPTAYMQVISEAHIWLRSEMNYFSSSDEDSKKLLTESSLKMAEFLARAQIPCTTNVLSSYFKMAGLSTKDVMKKYYSLDIPEDEKYKFGDAMVKFLKSYLLDKKSEPLNRLESEFTLKVIYKNEPSFLTRLFLNSKLLTYTFEFGTTLMNKHKLKMESNGERIASRDTFCLSYLNLNLANPAHAEGLLKEISEASLIDLCSEYKHLLFTDSYMLTAFGQLIKKHFKTVFASFLIKSFEQNVVDVENILQFFKKSSEETVEVYSYKVCEILEAILSDSSGKRNSSKVLVALIDRYLYHLSKGIVPDSWKLNHKHIPKRNNYFADRYTWLNSLHPFSGEFPTPKECILSKTNTRKQEEHMKSFSQQSSSTAATSFPNKILSFNMSNSPHSASSPRNKIDVEKLKDRMYCPCCCCGEVLLKFQSLLSSRYNRKELSNHVIKKLADASFVGKESLLLLCWPKAGYGKEWQLLLQYLFTTLKTSNYEQWNQSAYIDCLRGVLLRLSRAYTPLEFISFLPSDGSAQFFLPFIRECWEYNKAMSLKKQFLDTYKQPTKES